MDQLVAMRVFARVAERGSFAQAASDLDISKAAVSAHVASLEKHLKVRLLQRTTRRVSLTEEGTDYLGRCRRILSELKEADEVASGARTRVEGVLRVDVPTAFGRHLLLPALPEFMERYPGLQIDLRLNDSVTDLVAERVDVAMRVGPVRASGLAVRRVGAIRFVTCASPKYLEAHGIPRTPDDLRGHRLVGLVVPTWGGMPEWAFPPPYTPQRLKLRHALIVNDPEAPVIAATHGLGIARSSDLVVARAVGRGDVQLILPEFTAPGPTISLVYPSAGHHSLKVRVFSDFAADLLKGFSDMVRGWFSDTPAPAA